MELLSLLWCLGRGFRGRVLLPAIGRSQLVRENHIGIRQGRGRRQARRHYCTGVGDLHCRWRDAAVHSTCVANEIAGA